MLFRWFSIIATLLSNAFDKTKKTERSNLKSKNSKQAKKKNEQQKPKNNNKQKTIKKQNKNKSNFERLEMNCRKLAG